MCASVCVRACLRALLCVQDVYLTFSVISLSNGLLCETFVAIVHKHNITSAGKTLTIKHVVGGFFFF